jgi:predicted nucleotidyltransferase
VLGCTEDRVSRKRFSSARVFDFEEFTGMLSPEHIAEVARRLAAQLARPSRILLFGSYARGDADEASDLDLMVVESELPDRAAEYLRLREAIGRTGVGVDLLLLSEHEFERRSQVPGTAAYWVKKEGRVLHDSTV